MDLDRVNVAATRLMVRKILSYISIEYHSTIYSFIQNSLNISWLLGMGTKGYDCLEIPGAAVGTMCADFEATRLNANVFCGNSAGLATKKEAKRDGTNNGTVCSKAYYL